MAYMDTNMWGVRKSLGLFHLSNKIRAKYHACCEYEVVGKSLGLFHPSNNKISCLLCI